MSQLEINAYVGTAIFLHSITIISFESLRQREVLGLTKIVCISNHHAGLNLNSNK